MAPGGETAGAAWYRLFDDGDRGFGFVAFDIPELGIGVVPGWRGRGAGEALLRELVAAAREDGHAALSLSVEESNDRALALYERLGFMRVEQAGDSWTMVLDL